MAIDRSPNGGWRARWRDPEGRQRAKTFPTKAQAAAHLRTLTVTAVSEAEAIQRELAQLERHMDVIKLARQHPIALDASVDPEGFYVYCLWGSRSDRPLYVGRSSNIFARIGDHFSDPARRHLIRRVSLSRCETYEEMCDLEQALIRHWNPRLNIRLRSA